MLNTINSLVNNFASTAGNTSNGNVTDYQGKTYDRNQLLALSRQVAASIDPNAIKGGVFSTKGESVGFNYDEATKVLGHPPTAAEQVILDMSRHFLNEGVTDLNKVDATDTNRRFGSTFTGGGGTIYEVKKDADGKPIISSWSKDTSDKKTILTGLAIAALAFGIPGVTEGLLSGAPAGTTLGTVAADTAAGSAFELANAGVGAFEGGTALSSLAAMTPAELAAFEAQNAGASAFANTAGTSLASMTPAELAAFEAQNAGATAMTDLGASELANAGATAMTDLGASELTNAGATANTVGGTTAANTAANTTAAANAAKTGLLGLTTADALALQAGGTLLGTALNQNAIGDVSDIINQAGTTGTQTLSNVYQGQKDINAANNAMLAKNYSDLVTNLNTAGNRQIGLYDTTNTNLANNYAAAQTKLGDIYNAQVGYQQPYQNIGKRASTEILANTPYFTKQFGTADLNTELAPNYAFQLGQGQMANQRAGNISGGALGGNVMRGLQDYTQNYASGAYQNAFNNFQTQRQNIYNTLSNMANIGTTSAGQLANLGNTYGSNLGALSSNYGGNLVSNTGQLQGAYNQYGSNLTNAANNYGGNITTGTGQVINAGNVYGTNQTGLTTGLAAAQAQNRLAGSNVASNAINTVGNTVLLSSLIKPT
jgi:hypothetical protein